MSKHISQLDRPSLAFTSFVSVRDGHFFADGKPFRHVGANVPGILYSSLANEAQPLLQKLAHAGVKHVRALLPNTQYSTSEIISRLNGLLNAAGQWGIRLTLVFTDLYGGRCFETEGRSGFYSPRGDEAFRTYPWSGALGIYNDRWFHDGYSSNYQPLVEAILRAFGGHPGIFSWQVGGELKNMVDDAQHPEVAIPDFLNFFRAITQHMKQLDPNHLIGAGLMNTFHPYLDGTIPQWNKRAEFYSNPYIDYVSISIYDADAELMIQRVPPNSRIDSDLASLYRKPYVVHEVGFAKANPRCSGKKTYTDPVGQMWAFFASAYDYYSADAVMPWAWNFNSSGGGTHDWCYGPQEQNLVNEYLNLSTAWASLLNQRNG